MEVMDVNGNRMGVRESCDKPRLERLGSFRDLTQCGSLLDFLLGRNLDDCVFRSPSGYSWHR
jgi:hypothetical protein